MALSAFGKLIKLTILAYPKVTDSGKKIGSPIPFPVMYNPTSFTETKNAVYSCDKRENAQAENLRFKRSKSGDIKMDFLFDSTGTSISGGVIGGAQAAAANVAGGVDIQIALFKELCFGIDGEKHRPNYLTIVWGSFILDCQMMSYSVKYDLFNSLGRPIRATVSCTFKETATNQLDALFSKLSSPDLTKIHLVKDGETIYNIAEDAYGDTKFYTEIARVNNLTNFRRLKPGQQLALPPIAKTNA